MKRLLAALVLVCAAGSFTQAIAATGGGATLFSTPVKWRTTAAATVGVYTDSTVFKETGGSNATRDTTAWIDISDMAQTTNAATVSDSTLFMTLYVHPRATDPYSGSTFGIGSDSLYAYVEATDDPSDGPNGTALTNLTEILTLETGTNDSYRFRVTWARGALQLAGYKWVRWIVRGDLNGCWEGSTTFLTASAGKSR